MSQLMTYDNNMLIFSPQIRHHSPFNILLKAKKLEPISDTEEKLLRFLFFVHDRDSTYSSIHPLSERKEVVALDMGMQKTYFSAIEKDPRYEEARKRLEQVQYTVQEKTLQMYKKKMDEFHDMMDELKFDKGNFRQVAPLLKASKDLLATYTELQKMLSVDADEQIRGGGEASMFENGNNIVSIRSVNEQ